MVHLENVYKTYHLGNRSIEAVQGVSLEVAKGEIFGVVGHSGAGKSTLLRLLNRLETADSGRVLVAGEDLNQLGAEGLRAARQKIGMIFQHFNLITSRTVAQNVSMPLRIAGWRDSKRISTRVDELLNMVGLSDQHQKYPRQLSGGQKQRVGIARALANQPKILLCDEATSALDPQTTRSILALLSQINEKLGITIVLITHEMNVVRMLCDKVAVMDGGKIVESGEVAQVFLHPEHHTSRQFVREAEHFEELDEILAVANQQGRVVRMTFKGEDAYSPHLANSVKEHGLEFSILAGHVGRIKNTPCGQLILALQGGVEQQDKAIASLVSRGVNVEFLS